MANKIVDYFPYFNEKELLELRIKLLYDYVDKFIIVDANYTHSGIPKPFTCKTEIKSIGLSFDKIEVIELDLSPDKIKNPIDYDLYYDNTTTIASRERLQRDELVNYLQYFDNDDVFIISDCDEIINPNNIKFLSNVLKNQYDNVIKIPLILLECRANLRTYFSDGVTKKPWDKSMFFCLKHHLEKSSPTKIRSEYFLPFNITYVTENGEILQDLGWHFTWMGDTFNRALKAKSYCHAKNDLVNAMLKYLPGENSVSPESIFFNNNDFVLKKFPEKYLPQLIFKLPNVKNFLLP